MDINEMQQKRSALITNVIELLNDFTDETGVTVTSVNIDTIGRVGGSPAYMADIEVKL